MAELSNLESGGVQEPLWSRAMSSNALFAPLDFFLVLFIVHRDHSHYWEINPVTRINQKALKFSAVLIELMELRLQVHWFLVLEHTEIRLARFTRVLPAVIGPPVALELEPLRGLLPLDWFLRSFGLLFHRHGHVQLRIWLKNIMCLLA